MLIDLWRWAGWSWGCQVLFIRQHFWVWAQGRIRHTVLTVGGILWRRRQGWVGDVLLNGLFIRGCKEEESEVESDEEEELETLPSSSLVGSCMWRCFVGRGVARKTDLLLEMQIKVTAGAGAGRDETCCFRVTTLFGLVRHSSSFCSVAAFQAPCRPTGSNLSPSAHCRPWRPSACAGGAAGSGESGLPAA